MQKDQFYSCASAAFTIRFTASVQNRGHTSRAWSHLMGSPETALCHCWPAWLTDNEMV